MRAWRLDPVVARLLAGGAVVIAAFGAALIAGRAGAQVSPVRVAGIGLAARGCLDPDVATVADWRVVPGVTKSAAVLLAAQCTVTRACAPCGPTEAVRGVGGVVQGHIQALLCRKPDVDPKVCPARTHRAARARPVP